MAKGTTYELHGEIVKGVGYRGKQWGVPVLFTFADGRKVESIYTADRKKDIVAAMQPGALNDRALAACLDEIGRLSFCYVFGANGLEAPEVLSEGSY